MILNVRGKCLRKAGLVLISILMIAVSAAYSSAAPAKSAKPSPAQPAAKRDSPEWEKVVAAAKKEGKVNLYSSWTVEDRIAITAAFKAKYGIVIDFSPFGRGTDLLAKVRAEQTAGLYLADVFGAGLNTLALLKLAGVLGQLEPMLVLPEVTDGKNWSPGRLPFADKDKTMIGMISYLTRDLIYNTDLIKKGEITDYTDILKPQYKGKITMSDPSMPGSGVSFMTHLAVNLWDLGRARDYLAQLIGPQQTIIERDKRIQVEDVARGKYALGLAPNPSNLANLVNAGAHLDVVYFKQGVRTTSAAGALAVPTKSAHPNAAKLFVNWLLTKEGQTVFAQSFGNPSFRTDVSIKGLNRIFLLRPGEKVFPESEDFRSHTDEVVSMAKQVMDAASK